MRLEKCVSVHIITTHFVNTKYALKNNVIICGIIHFCFCLTYRAFFCAFIQQLITLLCSCALALGLILQLSTLLA